MDYFPENPSAVSLSRLLVIVSGNRTLINGGAGEIPEMRSDGSSCTVCGRYSLGEGMGKYELSSSANIETADRLNGLFQKTPYTHRKLWQGNTYHTCSRQ